MFFSIIIPVYNAEKYLPELVQSILCQGFQDFEVILVDDGSKDKSRELIQQYVAEDNRFKAVYQHNAGVSSARNSGIDIAQGEYILFADADDAYYETALATLFAHLSVTPADLICFGYDEQKIYKHHKKHIAHYYNQGRYEGEKKIGEMTLSIVGNDLFCSVWSKAYRTEIIHSNNLRMDEKLFMGEDYCFNLMMLNYCHSFEMIEDKLYQYKIQNADSIIQRYNPQKYEQLYWVHKIRQKYLVKNPYILDKQKWIYIRTYYIRICMSCFMDFSRAECNLNLKEQRAFIKNCLKMEPYKFGLSYISGMSLPMKVLYMFFSTKNILLIQLMAKVAFIIKFQIKKIN